MNTELEKGPWWVHLSFQINTGGTYIIFFGGGSEFEFAQNPSSFPRLADTAGEGSLEWFRSIGNAKETPLPSINHKGQARFGQASSHIQGKNL